MVPSVIYDCYVHRSAAVPRQMSHLSDNLLFSGAPRRCLFESFYVAFFKKRPPIQRAERWSPPQRRNKPRRFLLPSFSFAPAVTKEKRILSTKRLTEKEKTRFVYRNYLSAFFFDTKGPKKKAWQKRNAAKGVSPLRRRPTLRALDRRRLLKKACENFCASIAVKSPPNQNLKQG